MFHVYPHTCIVISVFGALEMHLYIIIMCFVFCRAAALKFALAGGLCREVYGFDFRTSYRTMAFAGTACFSTGLISGHHTEQWHSPGQHVSVLV